MVVTIQNRGYYPYIAEPDEVNSITSTSGRSDELFLQEAIATVRRWMEYADARLEGTACAASCALAMTTCSRSMR